MKQLLINLLFFFVACALNAQTATNLAWDYPVKPGSPQWETLSSHEEMLKVCQVPSGILSSVTTEELVEICLNYPMFFDFYAYNNLHEGVKAVEVEFNGLQELFMRKDNAQYLFNLLKGNDLRELPANTISTVELGGIIVRQSLAEMYLSNELVLLNATPEQQKDIAALAMKNMIIKESNPELYSRYSLETSAYLLCAGLKLMNGGVILSPNIEQFLSEGSLRDAALIEELKQNYSETVIK